jgi:phosphonate transport system substrate-binding protein
MILLLPAENQSAGSVLGGMKPAFDAITKSTGLHFDARASDSYASTVEGMVTRRGDIAYLGPYTYIQARKQGAAELLAVSVRSGRSTYTGAIFVHTDSGINSIRDLKGHSVAFGDVNSTSSFNYQCAMMLQTGIDPSRDLSKIYLTGSHANSIAALAAGKVDACCADLQSFELAVKNGRIDPAHIKIIAKTDPIPGSPIVMHPSLPAKLKATLRQAFADLAHNPNLGPNGLHGEDGSPLDRFDTTITDADYDKVVKFTSTVTDELKAAMLQKAATN